MQKGSQPVGQQFTKDLCYRMRLTDQPKVLDSSSLSRLGIRIMWAGFSMNYLFPLRENNWLKVQIRSSLIKNSNSA